MNLLGKEGTPFVFILDFNFDKCQVYPLSDVPDSIHFECSLHSTDFKKTELDSRPQIEVVPLEKEIYGTAFNQVKKELNFGNSFLLNLSFRSLIKSSVDLSQLYAASTAKFKLLIKDKLLVYSPERFIQIKGNDIFTFPMKGTISANIPNAEALVLKNEKELAEHYTIVDLLRNDLSIVATQVEVDQFRYIDRIHSAKGELLQVSSSIKGKLKESFKSNLGDLFYSLLPAGSVTGAPKKRTVEIIKEVEPTERGYYTGVFGVFDGQNVDSGVMIRCIQKEGENYYYHSGGGITFMSELEEELEELNQKIYVPSLRNNTNSRRRDPKSQVPRTKGQSI